MKIQYEQTLSENTEAQPKIQYELQLNDILHLVYYNKYSTIDSQLGHSVLLSDE